MPNGRFAMTDTDHLLPALLDVVASLAGEIPWGVVSLTSPGLLLLWDQRADADLGIMAAIVADIGGQVAAEGSESLSPIGHVSGAIVKPAGDAAEFADRLRFAYAMATQADPDATEDPF